MLELFEGKQGKIRLVEAITRQELVLYDGALAATLAEVAKLNPYAAKQDLYVEGEQGKGRLYFIVAGAVDVLVKGRRVDTVRKGKSLGEFPFLEPGQTYTVTARAAEPTVAAEVAEEDFGPIAEKYPLVWRNMAIMLMKRFRKANEKNIVPPKEPCVFIGHGRSPAWSLVQRYVNEELQLRSVSFESKPRAGMSTVAILDEMLQEATFAVLVLTGDDVAESGKRARQNVVHEAGLFQGALGFRRAILLVESGIEEFSNVHGLQHISFEHGRIEATFTTLRETLKREGLIS
jgi:predicted nucleotide-binding protein